MRFPVATIVSAALVAVAVIAWIGVYDATHAPGRAETQPPPVVVIDGDTIELDGEAVQIHGIDAPELGQRCLHDETWSRCGLDAAFALNKLLRVDHGPLSCMPPEGKPQQWAQVCLLGQNDLAEVLLKGGYAVALPDGPADYRVAQDTARQAGLGLWHDKFIDPAAWRDGERLPNESESADACPIKAVVAADGARLYHVPTDAGYAKVTLDPAKGDRRFCSDEEARQAGWRHAAAKG
jgi:endonuclease YncB( thermonuclease family)